MSRSVKLAVIPGDGIGPEVIAEAVKVLDAVTAGSGLSFEKTHFSLGADRYLATGDVLTDDDLDGDRARTTRSCSARSAARRATRGWRARTSSAACC